MITILAFLLLAALAAVCYFYRPTETLAEEPSRPEVKKLMSVATAAIKARKPLKAEKALIAILRLDEKNAAAYTRLGIIYAKSRRFKEARECFEIASSLEWNATSLYNVGLIYLETGHLDRARNALVSALELEGDQPKHYIALSRAEEKLGLFDSARDRLESAYALEPTLRTLKSILLVDEAIGDEDQIAATRSRISAIISRPKRTPRIPKPPKLPRKKI